MVQYPKDTDKLMTPLDPYNNVMIGNYAFVSQKYSGDSPDKVDDMIESSKSMASKYSVCYLSYLYSFDLT